MLEQSVPKGLHHVESTHTRTVCKQLQLMGKIRVGEASEALYPMGGTPHWRRIKV